MPAGDVRNSTAMVKLWRTDQMDRDGKPKLLQQIRIFAKVHCMEKMWYVLYGASIRKKR